MSPYPWRAPLGAPEVSLTPTYRETGVRTKRAKYRGGTPGKSRKLGVRRVFRPPDFPGVLAGMAWESRVRGEGHSISVDCHPTLGGISPPGTERGRPLQGRRTGCLPDGDDWRPIYMRRQLGAT